MRQYVVVDLEMCKVHSKRGKEILNMGSETIQIGAALLDHEYRVTDTYCAYVRPEYGSIDRYINRLTGISSRDVMGAMPFSEAMEDFSEWMPDNAVMVAWSNNDEDQIVKEARGKRFENPKLSATFGKWIDCQELFGQRLNSNRRYKLSDALMISGLWDEEKAHNALTDARNTASIFAKLNKSESIRANYSYIKEDEADSYIFNPFMQRCRA